MSIITIMTVQGRAQLAAAVANAQTFPSAKIVVGDGNGAAYAPNENQVALVHEVWRGNATVARTDDRVIFQAVVPADAGGFIVREVGVLIGAEGSEQLFIVSQYPSTEKIASPANGSGPLPIVLQFSANASEQAVLPIGSSDKATLQLSRPPHITVDDLLTAPPGSPVDGTMYAIDTGATGVFVGKGGWLVERVAGAWIYKEPPEKSAIRLSTNGNWYQRNAGDWVALDFNDPSIAWVDVTGKPGEFPPSAHNHDDRYFTETEADSRFVKKAGDTMTGDLGFGDAIKVKWGDTYLYGVNGTALLFAVAGTERMRVNNAGNVGIGTDSPTEKMHTTGVVKAEQGIHIGPTTGLLSKIEVGSDGASASVANTRFTSWHGFGFGPLVAGQPVPVGENAVWIDTRVGDIGFRGALKPNGNAGSAVHIMTGGAAAAWKTLAELGMGKKIIAIGVATSGSTITFAAAEPDTSYSALVWNGVLMSGSGGDDTVQTGTITSKTVSSCVVNYSTTVAAPPGGASASTKAFYIIYR